MMCKTARVMLQTDSVCFSLGLQEADSLPDPDLCPAAGRSRLPVVPAERKSDQPTSAQVKSVSTPLTILTLD